MYFRYSSLVANPFPSGAVKAKEAEGTFTDATEEVATGGAAGVRAGVMTESGV
jgi:hypothetical protein